jgi:hypothetical protein
VIFPGNDDNGNVMVMIIVYVIIAALIALAAWLLIREHRAARRRRRFGDAIADQRFASTIKAPYIASVLIRDYSPRPWWRRWLDRLLRRDRNVPWSPFDQGGFLRSDLMAVKLVDGQWVPNDEPNEGFYPIGSISEDEYN